MVRALGASAPEGSVLVDRRQLAGRHRRARRPARGGAAVGARPPPRAKGGARARLPRRVPPRARRRRRARARDGLRLLARPRRRAAADRGRRATPTSCSGRATSRAAGRELGARCGGSSRAAGRSTRRCCSRSAIRDLTGGFKCYRRAVLETIDLDAIDSKGYAFQIETTYRALRAGFRVVEVPITFADREVGGSKMSRAIVLEAIWKVPLLRLWPPAGRLQLYADASRSPTTRLRGGGPAAPSGPSSSTSGRPGAGRAARRADPRGARGRARERVGFVKLNIDENPVAAARSACSRSRR